MTNSQVLPDFKFKGDRNYIHGTDFFQALSKHLASESVGYVNNLMFRSFAQKQCAIYYQKPGADKNIICQGTWHETTSDKAIKFWVAEQGEEVNSRYEFDEDALCAGATISSSSIVSPFKHTYSVIENIVALTKKHHNSQLALESGKWVFAQITLKNALPDSCETIKIDNLQNIKNRFSRNSIIIDDHEIGEIRFIVA